MFTLNAGPCRRRSRALQEIEKPDTDLSQLERAFEFFVASGVRTGSQRDTFR